MSDFLHPERDTGGLLELGRLIEQAGEMGWDWFDKLGGPGAPDAKKIALTIERGQRLAQAMARLAGNDDFKLLLEHLVDTTILQPVQYVALGLPIDQTALNAARREGENALTWKLLKLIAEGRRAPVGPAKPESTNVLDEVSGPVVDGAAGGRGRRRRRRPTAG